MGVVCGRMRLEGQLSGAREHTHWRRRVHRHVRARVVPTSIGDVKWRAPVTYYSAVVKARVRPVGPMNVIGWPAKVA